MADYSDLTRILQERIQNWEGKASSGNSGFVVQVGDSVATVYGLDKAVYGELVEFASGATGIVLNLEEEHAGCVLLSGESLVKDGEEVKGTGKVVSVPSGESLFGRVLSPLGEPVDGKGPLSPEEFLPMESPAAPVIGRGSVDTPLGRNRPRLRPSLIILKSAGRWIIPLSCWHRLRIRRLCST